MYDLKRNENVKIYLHEIELVDISCIMFTNRFEHILK